MSEWAASGLRVGLCFLVALVLIIPMAFPQWFGLDGAHRGGITLAGCGPSAQERALCQASSEIVGARSVDGVTYWRGGSRYECVGGRLEYTP